MFSVETANITWLAPFVHPNEDWRNGITLQNKIHRRQLYNGFGKFGIYHNFIFSANVKNYEKKV